MVVELIPRHNASTFEGNSILFFFFFFQLFAGILSLTL